MYDFKIGDVVRWTDKWPLFDYVRPGEYGIIIRLQQEKDGNFQVKPFIWRGGPMNPPGFWYVRREYIKITSVPPRILRLLYG